MSAPVAPPEVELVVACGPGQPGTNVPTNKMKIKTLLCAGVLALALVFDTLTSFAGGLHHYKVRYSLHGLGKEMIVAAESTSDVRATVQNLVPDAVVYSAIEIH